MGPMPRDEWITAVVFILMILAWVFAGALKLNLAAVAIAGLGTLATFLWLALLFALSGQLNELGFMGVCR